LFANQAIFDNTPWFNKSQSDFWNLLASWATQYATRAHTIFRPHSAGKKKKKITILPLEVVVYRECDREQYLLQYYQFTCSVRNAPCRFGVSQSAFLAGMNNSTIYALLDADIHLAIANQVYGMMS
jgi:hypothetical protein